jgi:membrane-associated protein
MEWLKKAADFFLHIDKHLEAAIAQYQGGTSFILLAIIFIETGIVIMPFLPGDSLLFAAGVFAERGSLSLAILLPSLSIAAILGDTLNYWIGKYAGNWVLRGPLSRFVKQKHIDLTHSFFEKYGGKTIIMARFVPIVRTFAPFVAGIGAMTYRKFLLYNIVGGIAWVAICLYAGYFFGRLEFVKKNFEVVVLAIVFISILPGIIEYWKHRRQARAAAMQSTVQDKIV